MTSPTPDHPAEPLAGSAPWTVRLATWTADGDRLCEVRREVFVLEQGVPEVLEWDGLDAACEHAVAETAKAMAVGTGRLLPDGHLGRMAVRRDWRGRGVGSALLGCLVSLARNRGSDSVALHAQTHALGFYARHGFVVAGEPFMDAGIAHRTMHLRLGP